MKIYKQVFRKASYTFEKKNISQHIESWKIEETLKACCKRSNRNLSSDTYNIQINVSCQDLESLIKFIRRELWNKLCKLSFLYSTQKLQNVCKWANMNSVCRYIKIRIILNYIHMNFRNKTGILYWVIVRS